MSLSLVPPVSRWELRAVSIPNSLLRRWWKHLTAQWGTSPCQDLAPQLRGVPREKKPGGERPLH